MTYNVFSGTLNLTQSKPRNTCSHLAIHCLEVTENYLSGYVAELEQLLFFQQNTVRLQHNN